jgi:hypothetical protein
VGSRRDCTWILGSSGFRVMRIEGEEETHSRLQIHVERRGRCYPCTHMAGGFLTRRFFNLNDVRL